MPRRDRRDGDDADHGARSRPPDDVLDGDHRDLIDLVSIVRGASVPAAEQAAALHSEFGRRQLSLPQTFDAPDRALS
jgi:hypothetical protein